MPELRIAGLCSGTGALEMAVQEVLGGTFAWHCQWEPPDKNGKPDKWQYAARILAHHWPDVPNHGDITKVDWATVERPNVLAMGFPCTDVSSAGQRAGIAEGTRSGVWFHCARAIEELRPDLVVIENVEGLLSARADRGVGATDADVEAAGDDALRALGCVLGDLADRGYDTEWCRVAASDVGAPHRRYRIIILARPSHANRAGLEGRRLHGPTAERLGAAANPADLGHERHRNSRDGRPGPEDGDLVAADAQCPTCGCGVHYHDAGGFCAGPCWGNCPDPDLGRPDGGWNSFDDDANPEMVAEYARKLSAVADARSFGASDDGELPPGRDALRRRLRDDIAGRRPDAAADSDRGGLGMDERDAPAGESDFDWRAYGPAIRRWERILGRPAPRPVDDRGRLSARFVEWMMGLPEGHVCDVPAPEGMTAAGLRNARLKALGNGVVRQQAAYALRLLLDRMGSEAAA